MTGGPSPSADPGGPKAGEPIAGVLLAGGLSRRMGGENKAWKTINGLSLIEHVAGRAGPQVNRLVINAAEDSRQYDHLNLPVVADCLPGRLGPLAGVLSGLEWARDQVPPYRWVASFAVDTPFIPVDLVETLASAVRRDNADIACAMSGRRRHPVFALWPVALAGDLRTALQQGVRKIEDWTGRHTVALHEFVTTPFDPFFNVNRPEDLARAEAIIAASTPQ